MAYVHVAHDCHVGNDTIFGNMATLGGHVTVEDFANVSAGSGVHQFCRVGRHAFIGGYSVVTKDALPFARTVGSRPARIFGPNTIGLMRRGFPPDVIDKLKGSFRYLLQSKMNTTKAMQQIQQDRSLACAEVEYLLDFIRTRSAASSCAAPPGGPKCSRTNDHDMIHARRHEGCTKAHLVLVEFFVSFVFSWFKRMRLGLIAGNGRFPFLVLDAARGAGPRRHGCRHQGRNLPRPERGRRPPEDRAPLGLARPARAAASTS